jgi:hypothetical protein
MTKDEALQMCLEYIETDAHERRHVRWAIKEALAQTEQPPQRTWHGLTDKQTTQAIKSMPKGIKGWMIDWDLHDFSKAIEAKLKENNHG